MPIVSNTAKNAGCSYFERRAGFAYYFAAPHTIELRQKFQSALDIL